ncbi:hypothetical protein LINPERHAP2_LOCUS19439 [Linum perenne]
MHHLFVGSHWRRSSEAIVGGRRKPSLEVVGSHEIEPRSFVAASLHLEPLALNPYSFKPLSESKVLMAAMCGGSAGGDGGDDERQPDKERRDSWNCHMIGMLSKGHEGCFLRQVNGKLVKSRLFDIGPKSWRKITKVEKDHAFDNYIREEELGRPPTRGELFRETHQHTGRTGPDKYPNEETREALETVERFMEDPATHNHISTFDVVGRAFNEKEHPGRVRGLGFGPTPSQVVIITVNAFGCLLSINMFGGGVQSSQHSHGDTPPSDTPQSAQGDQQSEARRPETTGSPIVDVTGINSSGAGSGNQPGGASHSSSRPTGSADDNVLSSTSSDSSDSDFDSE